MKKIGQAVILAAGEGQRLRPLTASRPKVMLFIGGKPILQYAVEALVQSGIRRLIIVIGYRREQVQDYFSAGQDFGAEINYVTQEHQLGTAHALKQAMDMTDDRFIVLPGDNIIEADTLTPLLDAQNHTVLVRKTEDEDTPGRGIVIVDKGMVRDIVEKPLGGTGGLLNTGIYTLGKDIFPFAERELDLPDALRMMIVQGHTIFYRETTGRWMDVVHYPDILKLNDAVLRDLSPALGGNIEPGSTIKGAVSIGKETIIRSNCYIVGPASIGENCEIGPNVCILPSTSISNNVVISPFTLLKNCLIYSDVNIGPSSTIEDSVIASGSVLRGHFAAHSGETVTFVEGLGRHRMKMGVIIGEDCRLEDSITTRPGIIIGNHCRIKAMNTVNENIPDESMVV